MSFYAVLEKRWSLRLLNRTNGIIAPLTRLAFACGDKMVNLVVLKLFLMEMALGESPNPANLFTNVYLRY